MAQRLSKQNGWLPKGTGHLTETTEKNILLL